MSLNTYKGLVTAPAPGKPLIFAFHGTGGDEHQFAGLVLQLFPGAGLVSPRGDVSEMGANRFFKRTGEGVYDMEDLAERTEAMAAFVAAHKAENPGTPIYGFGYSNGANILASVMLRHPDLFDRVGLLHPLIPWTPEPVPGLRDKPVLVTAGRRDPITPWAQSEKLIDWLAAQGAKVATAVHDGGHELQQAEVDALVDLFSP
ncbi:MAG: alpha/beta hydrolase [Pseudomonadota bacterium]